MLPGVAPTGRNVEIPHVAVVKFKNNKISHEHIYWDQASVLVQIGLLKPEKIPITG
jgi:carboxymethylenebutenolidase